MMPLNIIKREAPHSKAPHSTIPQQQLSHHVLPIGPIGPIGPVYMKMPSPLGTLADRRRTFPSLM